MVDAKKKKINIEQEHHYKLNKSTEKFGLGFIFLLGMVLTIINLILPNFVLAADLYLYPSVDSYNVGQIFSVIVYVSSTDQTMNAASGVISFPKDKLNVISISKSGSIFSLWVQEPTFSNSTGTINFEGIVLNSGFIGLTGKILAINFKAKNTGNASLAFSSGSVLANDGRGTSILEAMDSASYTLNSEEVTPQDEEEKEYIPPTIGVPTAPKVSSSTHPDSEKWYSNNDPEFSWKLPSDVTGVSFLLYKSSIVNPGPISDGIMESKKFEDIDDGIWYFHIQLKNKYGWGEITHRKVLIDTVPPELSEIETQKDDPLDPRPKFLFTSTDNTSGISYYEVKIGKEYSETVSAADIKEKPYQVPPQSPGKHMIEVKVFDRAGNFSSDSIEIEILPIEEPSILNYPERIRIGEILEIRGRSLPETSVIIFIQREENVPILEEVKTDSQGDWKFVYEKALVQGRYSFWAQAKDGREALSYPTQKYFFEIGLPPFLKLGKITIEYLTTVVTLLILIVAAVVIIFYAWYRILLWRKKLKTETTEAEKALRKAFSFLRKRINEQIRMFDSRPGLSGKERRIRDSLEDSLKIAKEIVAKEIKDIEKELE